jgi:hypothetical protein
LNDIRIPKKVSLSAGLFFIFYSCFYPYPRSTQPLSITVVCFSVSIVSASILNHGHDFYAYLLFVIKYYGTLNIFLFSFFISIKLQK